MAQKSGATFVGSIPENYDRYLAPIQLEPFAGDLAKRVPTGLRDVLELACGTGVVTRHLRERLDEQTNLVATDFSEGMLKYAQSKPGYSKKIEWKVADATALPFKDNSFDSVVCGFGVMFFADKDKAASEIFRVLRPGGRLLFNTWDKIEFNDFPHIVHDLVEEMFAGDPPPFYQLPFGYHDHYEIRTLLRRAGFVDVALTTVEMKVQGTPADAAIGLVKGNPIGPEIEQRLGKDLSEVVDKAQKAVADELGSKMAKGRARAIIVGGRKPGQLAPRPVTPAASASATPESATKPRAAVRKPTAAKTKASPKTKPAAKPRGGVKPKPATKARPAPQKPSA